MLKAGSRIKVISICKAHQGSGKLYPLGFEEMIGEEGIVTKRKNKSGFVELDLDNLGRNWAFVKEDLEVIND